MKSQGGVLPQKGDPLKFGREQRKTYRVLIFEKIQYLRAPLRCTSS